MFPLLCFRSGGMLQRCVSVLEEVRVDSNALDNFAAGLVIVNRNGAIVDCNSVFEDWIGIARGGWSGASLGDFLAPPAPPANPDEYLPGIAEIARADGTVLPVLVASSDSTDGRRHLVLFDATEQRKFREQLSARHALRQRTQTR